VERLHATVERVLAGKADVKELLRHRPKPVLPSRKAGIAAGVVFDSEASGTATLIEIVAEDRRIAPACCTIWRRPSVPTAGISRWC